MGFHPLLSFRFKDEGVPAVRQGMLRVLIHRARKALADVGSIRLDGDRVILELRQSILVRDPRSEQPLEDKMLRLLARAGTTSAKVLAVALDVSIRAAQLALGDLVDEGAVVMKRRGRNVGYRVEDTTFQEPTRFTKDRGNET